MIIAHDPTDRSIKFRLELNGMNVKPNKVPKQGMSFGGGGRSSLGSGGEKRYQNATRQAKNAFCAAIDGSFDPASYGVDLRGKELAITYPAKPSRAGKRVEPCSFPPTFYHAPGLFEWAGPKRFPSPDPGDPYRPPKVVKAAKALRRTGMH
jgi:hypothetical protein